MRVFPICVNLNIFNSVDIRYGTSSLACYVKLKIIVALPAAMFAEDYYISIISKTQFALRRASSILSTMYARMLLCSFTAKKYFTFVSWKYVWRYVVPVANFYYSSSHLS